MVWTFSAFFVRLPNTVARKYSYLGKDFGSEFLRIFSLLILGVVSLNVLILAILLKSFCLNF